MINKDNPKVREKIHELAKQKRGGNLKFNTSFDISRLSDPSKMFANNHLDIDFSTISSCAIVGNSGKVLDYKNGDFIDQHDLVIRMNAAPTRGYESYVGKQTDFRFLNGMMMKGADQKFNQTEANWIENIKDERIVLTRTTIPSYVNAIQTLINENKIYFFSDFALDYLNDFENQHGFDHASLGMVATLVFLKICDVVNLFGFGFHRESLDKKHYYERFSSNGAGDHNWDLEEQIMMELNFLNYVNLIDLH